MKFLKKYLVTIILFAVALAGLGLLLYPSFSDWWNRFHQSRVVAAYADKVANMNTEEFDALFESAEAYNEEITRRGIIWTMTDEERERYLQELDVTGTGNMGYIEIPKIQVMLPIYHGTNESVLQIATGHIEGSSLPVGGLGTHTIISGHRGLPSATLFSDLDDLIVGDTFTINVLNRTLTYEVDQIRTVLPYDLSELTIDREKDYCTLVTCTPIGVNTHRILVRAHRIENAQGEALVIPDAMQVRPIYIAPFIAAPVLLILILIVLFSTGQNSRKKKERERSIDEEKKRAA
jgi:sortase A